MQRLSQRHRAVDLACRRRADPTGRPRRPVPSTRHSPTPSKFSSAKPSGSITRWQVAHVGVRAVLLRCRARSDCGFLAGLVVRAARARSAAARGGGVPRMFSRIHLPRSTGDVRFGYDVTVRMLPWPSRPRRSSSGQRHAAEVAAVDVRDAVVPRQPLVDERVVGVQQVEDAAVLAHDALEEQLGLRAERLRAARCRSSGSRPASGCGSCRLRSISHWLAKLSTSARDFGSASIRSHLLLEHRRLAQSTLRRERPAAHRRGSSSRGRTRAATPARGRVTVAGRRLRPVQSPVRNRNFGFARTRRRPCSMPSSNVPFFAPDVVERRGSAPCPRS